MPATTILKNIPDDVYARLKLSAKTHRRSLNSEAIAGLHLPGQSTALAEDFLEHDPKKPMKP